MKLQLIVFHCVRQEMVAKEAYVIKYKHDQVALTLARSDVLPMKCCNHMELRRMENCKHGPMSTGTCSIVGDGFFPPTYGVVLPTASYV